MVVLDFQVSVLKDAIEEAENAGRSNVGVVYPDSDLISVLSENLYLFDDIVRTVDKKTWLHWIKYRFLDGRPKTSNEHSIDEEECEDNETMETNVVDDNDDNEPGADDDEPESNNSTDFEKNDIHVVVIKNEPEAVENEIVDTPVPADDTRDLKIETIYQCQDCHAIFFNRSEYDKHDTARCHSNVRSRNAKKQRRYVCKECEEDFSSKIVLQMHMEETHPLVDYSISDYDENLNVSQDDNLVEESTPDDVVIEKWANDEENYDLNDLNSVMKNLYKRCPICPKEFLSKRGYDNHVKIHQTNGDDVVLVENKEKITFECPICTEVFTDGELFKTHVDSHTEIEENELIGILPDGLYCEVCGRGFSSENIEYKKHMKKHIEKGEMAGKRDTAVYTYYCFICKAGFQSKKGYGMHLQRHMIDEEIDKDLYSKLMHTSTKPVAIIQCHLCKKVFSTKKGYKYHMQNHSNLGEYHETADTEDATRNFSCQVCSETFKTDEDLFGHAKVHENGHRWKCLICDKTLKDKRGLQTHLRRHSEGKQYVCETCGAQFADKPNLSRHRTRHNPDKPFKCHICSKSFSLKEYLVAHLKTHLKIRPFICEICGKGFTCKRVLDLHVKYHSADYKDLFHCDQCDKTFVQKGNLKKHKEIIHEGIKKFQCTVCHKLLGTKWSLTSHMYSHTNEPMPFPCHLCDRTFLTKTKIDEHLAHHAGKTYQCTMCEKRYRFKNKLTIHMRTHTGSNPYACNACGQKFHRNDILVRHCKRFHPGDTSAAGKQVAIQNLVP